MGWLIASILSGAVFIAGIATTVQEPKINNVVAVIVTLALTIVFFKKYKDDKNGVVTKMCSTKDKKRLGCLIPIIIFLMLGASLVYAVQNADELGSTQDGIIMNATNLTKEQAIEVNSILKECAIEKVDSVTHDELLDEINVHGEKGYRLKVGNINNIILYITQDNKVNMLRWADNSLYEGGEVVAKITDYTLSTNEASNLQVKCQNVVKSVLKSPSTAKFPSIMDWSFSKDKEKIVIQSYVDSQNSFGAELRSEFQIILSNDGNNIKSFIFDGQEYVK